MCNNTKETLISQKEPPSPLYSLSISFLAPYKQMKYIYNNVNYLLYIIHTILLILMILFVFQRSFYLFFQHSAKHIPNTVKEHILYRKDKRPIVLDIIDNKSDVDYIIAMGNVIDYGELYNMANRISKKYKYNVIYYKIDPFCNYLSIRSEKDIKEDYKEIALFLKSRNTKKKGFGFSFGCAFIAYLTCHCEFEKIVFHNPFVSLRSLVEEFILFRAFSTILVDTWNNYNYIKKFKGKVIIISSEKDEIISIKHSKMLRDCNDNAKMILLPQEGHNTVAFYDNSCECYIMDHLK